MNLTQHKAFFDENGYAVVQGLFTPDEVAQYREHYMRLRAQGPKPGDMVADTQKSGDPLQRYPRMIHMHRWDDLSLRWVLDARIADSLRTFLGDEPLAVQTMLYFKPAGARGQALHQDNFYLRAHPGTCMAAWLALDPCDEENGCMRVVPGSHTWPILCTAQADTSASFTDVTVPIPDGQEVRPVLMDAGDVLFFNGSLVHGSYPNTSADRFRRALIGHYIEAKAEQVTKFDQPVLKMDGTAFEMDGVEEGGPCGVWVDRSGRPEIEIAGRQLLATGHE
ncbi:MAG: phytanoyl-CoA dioxygenase family protein [Armatimonadetes bacterium]|nr:phytanoyl-CoA dioxygenase family protein [Armatimonadota bacterium]